MRLWHQPTSNIHNIDPQLQATIARCDHFGNLQPSLVGWFTHRGGSDPLDGKMDEALSCLYRVDRMEFTLMTQRLGDLVLVKGPRDPSAKTFDCSKEHPFGFLSHFSSMNDLCKFLAIPKCPSSSALGSRIADPCWRHRSRFGRWRLQFSPPGFVFFFLTRLKMPFIRLIPLVLLIKIKKGNNIASDWMNEG